ncbi:MAG: sigma-70 family RNA polymerase sigma factor [Pseudomonadota bacterium]
MTDDARHGAPGGSAAAIDREALLRFVARRTGDWALAEDVVQDTVVKMIEYAERAVIADPGALAFRVAENLVRDHFRGPRNKPYVLLNDDLRDTTPGAETQLMDRQRLALVERVIADMPAKRREVLTRRRIHNESLEQIAEAMNLSPAAVEKNLVRALAQLRSEVEAELVRASRERSAS